MTLKMVHIKKKSFKKYTLDIKEYKEKIEINFTSLNFLKCGHHKIKIYIYTYGHVTSAFVSPSILIRIIPTSVNF